MTTILVATDLSARSDRAVARAARMAAAMRARLVLLHVADDDLPGAVLQSRMAEAETALTAMVAATPALSDLAPEIRVEAGRRDRLIARLAEETGADLVVLGSHRDRGLAEMLGAPTLSRLLRGLTVPVLVAVGRPEADWSRVVIGWDFSPAADGAAAMVRVWAPEATVTLVHSWGEPVAGVPYAFETGGAIPAGAVERLEAELERAAAALGWDNVPATEVSVGPAGWVLRRMAEDGQADLLALGRHARTGFARFLLGATAEDVALRAPCDVLIAPPPAKDD